MLHRESRNCALVDSIVFIVLCYCIKCYVYNTSCIDSTENRRRDFHFIPILFYILVLVIGLDIYLFKRFKVDDNPNGRSPRKD